jgi:DNA-binding CsgD family transcriptional regulator
MSVHVIDNETHSQLAHASARWLTAILDQIDVGLILVDGDGARHFNRAARIALAQAEYPLRFLAGRLCANTLAADAQLESAIADALHHARRRLLTLRSATHTLPLAVVPLTSEAPDIATTAALLVLGKRQLCSRLAEQWFCLSHGLTPAESTVLSDILAGHGPSTIADRGGVAISTVRSHIASIRDKTATAGIRDLMLTAAALPPMISATAG